MEETELHRQKRAEIDIWDALLQRKVREYVAQGFSCEKAEEKAWIDVGHAIRQQS